MRRLAELALHAVEGGWVLDECLDGIIAAVSADRAFVIQVYPDRRTQVVAARGLQGALNPVEWHELSVTILHKVRASGETMSWGCDLAEPPPSGTLLGIRRAFAAPLTRAEGTGDAQAILYVDARGKEHWDEEWNAEFLSAAAALVGITFEHRRRAPATGARFKGAAGGEAKAPSFEELLAPSSMDSVRHELETCLHGNLSVLILGESGTGKTLLAQSIAEASDRKPIVRAVLGSSDDLNTITSELFGHERGAYSGAAAKRTGLVEFASGGTLILDEILNLSLHGQKLLLDFCQFGNYRPLGHNRPEPKHADVRILAVTNGDIRLASREGRFREDLWQRLATVTLEIPPLRERRQDIPHLAEQILHRVDPERAWSLALPLRRLLASSSLEWPGNMRQLERVILRARNRALMRLPDATLLTAEHIQPHDIDEVPRGHLAPPATTGGVPGGASLAWLWEQLQSERHRLMKEEQRLLRLALTEAGGVVARAARQLGLARTTLASRLTGLRIPHRGRAAVQESSMPEAMNDIWQSHKEVLGGP